MSRKRYKPEQIINLLREAEVGLSQGRRVGEIGRSPGLSEQSSYRRRCVEHLRGKLGISERRACRMVGQHRSTQRTAFRGARG